MIRRPPRSTLSSSSAASDVYKRQLLLLLLMACHMHQRLRCEHLNADRSLRHMQESETECALDLKGQFACRPSCMHTPRYRSIYRVVSSIKRVLARKTFSSAPKPRPSENSNPIAPHTRFHASARARPGFPCAPRNAPRRKGGPAEMAMARWPKEFVQRSYVASQLTATAEVSTTTEVGYIELAPTLRASFPVLGASFQVATSSTSLRKSSVACPNAPPASNPSGTKRYVCGTRDQSITPISFDASSRQQMQAIQHGHRCYNRDFLSCA